MTTELAPLTANDVKAQVQRIQQVMAEVMIDGQHFGKIPGCGDKPALLKAGAEKIGLTFRLIPTFKIDKSELPNGHREYSITCVLSNPAGEVMGEGVGCCSTMEKKYRWRDADSFEVTDEQIPPDAKERKAEYRKAGYGMRKVDGAWAWVRFTGSQDRTENPDIADTYNTVLKMAKKRAHIDAILTTTAASDIFTQDIDEHPEPEPARPQPKQQTPPRGSTAEFVARLNITDGSLAQAGLCEPGQYLAAVASSCAGAGLGSDFASMTMQALEVARGLAASVAAEMRNPKPVEPDPEPPQDEPPEQLDPANRIRCLLDQMKYPEHLYLDEMRKRRKNSRLTIDKLTSQQASEELERLEQHATELAGIGD